MDSRQLRTLREWAEGLSRDDRPEVRAAAKAITMLADEVESLRAALLSELPQRAGEAVAATGSDEPEPGLEPAVDGDLRARLRSLARFRTGGSHT